MKTKKAQREEAARLAEEKRQAEEADVITVTWGDYSKTVRRKDYERMGREVAQFQAAVTILYERGMKLNRDELLAKGFMGYDVNGSSIQNVADGYFGEFGFLTERWEKAKP